MEVSRDRGFNAAFAIMQQQRRYDSEANGAHAARTLVCTVFRHVGLAHGRHVSRHEGMLEQA
jgi:hypothetical protein